MFKVGDAIILRKDSSFYKENLFNVPKNTVGHIHHISSNVWSDFNFDIVWKTGRRCYLREMDLQLAQPYLQQEEAKKLLGLKD